MVDDHRDVDVPGFEDLAPGDQFRVRLWNALIEAFVPTAHASTVWRLAHAIDCHWKTHGEQMFAEGFKAGQSEIARQETVAQLKREQLALMDTVLHTVTLKMTH